MKSPAAFLDAVEAALRSPDRLAALRALCSDELAAGASRKDLITRLEGARDHFRHAGREQDEDVILDALDLVTGWCSPHVALPGDREH